MKYIRASHDKTSLTAEFIAHDGTRYLRAGGTLSWRFFNPGNIRPSKTSVCNPLKIGIGQTKNGSFMIFPNDETGWQALKILLEITYKDFTVEQITNVYAPSKDHNNSEEYTNFIINEARVKGDDYIRDMDDATVERVMEAIKKMEGYYNKKETRKERVIPTTNIFISDGNKPIPNEKVKIIIDQCAYEWSSNKYGEVPAIAHLPNRNKIEILVENIDGKDEKVYSALAGATSKNILLLKSNQTFIAKTGAHKESEKSTEDYVVKKGDNLSKIARQFHTTVKRIANLNEINNVDVLSIGQKIKVPGGMSKPQLLKSTVLPTSQQIRKNQVEIKTGVSDNGYPQANIGNATEQAPWMKVAYQEGKYRWKWGAVKENDGGINYHKEIGTSNSSMSGTSNAWCASFVNFCLKQAGYLTSRSANSQSFAYSPNFVKVDAPVYGAIAVFHKKGSKRSGHVAFVYCKTKDGEIGVLGGNQADSVTVNPMYYVYSNPKLGYELIGYYVPTIYQKYAENIIKAGGDLEVIYNDIASVRKSLGSSPISTNDSKTR
ncbi:TIGR02594 family protein [Nissabacter archeti]|uniref:TIGR02594 family protein n=1 Tax=Nissabacter archeti TaxID=1917880 RepID=A0ABS5JCX4_9GAMM|nr:TIGR02594 family protein [Nissabacter archeti]MBS0967814.1 TIGR02594 family protein [Nissabacter archeti]